jgi:hypothetical protein
MIDKADANAHTSISVVLLMHLTSKIKQEGTQLQQEEALVYLRNTLLQWIIFFLFCSRKLH